MFNMFSDVLICSERLTWNGLNCVRLVLYCYKGAVSILSETIFGKVTFNTLNPKQNDRHFADDLSKCILLNENIWISINFSLKFVAKCQIDNIPSLVQIMNWHRLGDKPLSEPMMVSLLRKICVTRPQWLTHYRKTRPFQYPSIMHVTQLAKSSHVTELASNAENASISWRHHEKMTSDSF